MFSQVFVRVGAVVLLLLSSLMTSVVYAGLNLYDSKELDFLYPAREKTISMDFKGASLNDVLKIFSQQSGLNFIASDQVSGKTINLYLDKVPVEAALERILSSNGLTYELQEESNIFIVKQAEPEQLNTMTRVYRLRHATVSSSKLLTTLSSGDEEEDEEGGGSSQSSEEDDASSMGVLGALRSILSSNGSVVEDPRTNSLIVTDIPSKFPAIEQLIARLDVKIPQVLIEVEMLDISKDTVDLLGAKFGSSPVTFKGAEKDSFYPFNSDNAFDDHGDTAREDLFSEDPQYRVSTLSFAGLTFTLQFLRTQSDTKNLARPRILTLNNETAEINISTDEVISVTTNLTSGGSISQSTTEAERAQTGVSLKVTPQANVETGEITMAVEPKVIQARASRGLAGAANFKDPEERGTKSILRIFDGDTVVIGGLIRSDVADVRTSVPVLSKIPMLGKAFRHKDKSEVQRELIVFMTPHIITDNVVSASESTATPVIREQKAPSPKKSKQLDKEMSQFSQK